MISYICRCRPDGWLDIYAAEPMAWLIQTDSMGLVRWWP
jgi:hypothetical protein